ncbi:MAG: helix-turn-helix transcriptional regulator [Oscillospiraceae bacterium]|nr:helix-turn-helix transcriptional regulator [Oscillospiraceae bacterium]
MFDVGARLIHLRNLKGLTTNKLANLAGISQSHLREIELGKKNPTVETLSYFCDALGITLSDFFSETDNEINPILVSAAKNLTNDQQLKLADLINDIIK